MSRLTTQVSIAVGLNPIATIDRDRSPYSELHPIEEVRIFSELAVSQMFGLWGVAFQQVEAVISAEATSIDAKRVLVAIYPVVADELNHITLVCIAYANGVRIGSVKGRYRNLRGDSLPDSVFRDDRMGWRLKRVPMYVEPKCDVNGNPL